MGIVFNAVVYLSGYLFLIFVAICLSAGLYYLSELVEEHTTLTRRLLYGANVTVLIVHVLFMLFESLPFHALVVGLVAHLCYMWLLDSFPFMRLMSPSFIASVAVLILSHVFWCRHFISHFHQTTHVFCFFVLNVWLVPFGFFLSLSANESTLPDGRSARGSGALFGMGKGV